MQLYVGPRHVVSAQLVVAIAVPIENPSDYEVRGVIRFLQADEMLGYIAEEASSRLELFCCTTIHVRILPGRHKPCCVSNSIFEHPPYSPHLAPSDFFLSPKMEHLTGKRLANDEDLKDAVGGHMVSRGYTQTGAKVQVPQCLIRLFGIVCRFGIYQFLYIQFLYYY